MVPVKCMFAFLQSKDSPVGGATLLPLENGPYFYGCVRDLPGCAGLRIPSLRIRQFLEVRTADELSGEILRILDHGGDDQQRTAVSFIGAMEILGDDRIRAIRHTVLLQVTRPHVRADDFQVAAFSAAAAPAAGEFPLS